MDSKSKRQIDEASAHVAALYHAGRYAEAVRVAEWLCRMTETHSYPTHPDAATILNNLALLYKTLGDFARAELLYQRALAICENVLGPEHRNTARSLDNLAALYQALGEFARAEPLHRRALAICEKTLGIEHPDTAQILNNLAALYEARGDSARAEPLYRRALAICEKVLGVEHPNIAQILDNLAGLYYKMFNFGRAEQLYQRALAIRENVLGPEHPYTARSLNNLALLYNSAGDHARAEPLLQRALAIHEIVLGPKHPDTATSLNNLALLYRSLGDHARAAPLLQRALAIRENILGAEHPDTGASLNNLAGLFQALGDFGRAEPLLQRALAICESILGAEHPDTGASLNNLAGLFQALGDFGRAEPLLQRALAICESILGTEHPHTATTVNNLAVLYEARGDFAGAELLYQRALAINETALGAKHPDTQASLANTAVFNARQGRFAQALSGLARAAQAEDGLLGEVFALSPEQQRNRYLAANRELGMMLLSLVLAHFRDTPDAVRLALDYVLRRKALAAETASVQRRLILSGRYPQLRESLQRLDLLRGQVASKILSGPGAHETPQQYQQALAQWRAEREMLEREIARQIPEMRLERELASVDAHAVALHLQASGTLVEFVRFSPCHFHAVKARGEAQWGRERYAAFVLAPGDAATVQFVDLGDAAPIDDAIRSFQAEITGGPRLPADDRARMLPSREPTPPQSDRNGGSKLLQLLIAPLQELLQQRPSLVLAPDGELNRLSFAALPTDSGCLSDRYAIRYVSCGRDLVRFAAAARNAGGPPLIVADPAFDLGASASPGSGQRSRATSVAATQPGKMAALLRWLRGTGKNEDERSPDPAVAPPATLGEASGEPAWTGRRSRDLDGTGHWFSPLPGSRVEGETVGRHLGSAALLGEQALEGRCKKRRSPTIVHFATHGFFLADQPWQPPSGLLGDAGHRLSRQENPLLRSGLALAGANTFLRERRVVGDEMEDGLLTAEDVAGLDLLDTDLVFLSACETGLGDVQVGEGVFGLRRAFVVAGARTLIMSLWKVDDVATALLVDRFYTALLAGAGKGEALRQAQHELRSATVGTLRATWLNPENRSRLAAGDPAQQQWLNALLAYPAATRPFERPYYWAGFILQGDDGPNRCA